MNQPGAAEEESPGGSAGVKDDPAKIIFDLDRDHGAHKNGLTAVNRCYQKNGRRYQAILNDCLLDKTAPSGYRNRPTPEPHRKGDSDMTYRMLSAAALAVALAAPALAGETTTKIERSGFCYRGNCSAETKITREEPSKPNVGYLPNFSGTAGAAGSAPASETVHFPRAAEPAAPVDPKCAKVNACLKISPEATIY